MKSETLDKYKLKNLPRIERVNINIYKQEMPNLIKHEETINILKKMNYFSAPSACGHHGNWIGGNFEHSLLLTKYLLEYSAECPEITWKRAESPYIIGMFHDLCKCDERCFSEINGKLKISITKNKGKAHATKSLQLIKDKLHLCLTDDEKTCIYYHMGKFTYPKDNLSLNQAIQNDVKVLWTQIADTQAAIVDKI